MAATATARTVRAQRALRVLLTTTSATNVFGAPVPVVGRNRFVRLWGEANTSTAATTLTLTVTYTHPDLGVQQATVVNGTSEPVGLTPITGGPFLVAGGTAVTVTATAGTANQIRLSIELQGA
jgi:hypothetical protein